MLFEPGRLEGIAGMNDHAPLQELAAQLRVDSIRVASEAGSGHPTSSMSAADLMAVLMSGHFRYDFDDPGNPNNDHLVFSKGHASPLLYSMYRAAGAMHQVSRRETTRQILPRQDASNRLPALMYSV